MVNIIEKKLDIENEALKRFEMIGKFISCKPKIITGSIRSIDKTNISYIEPHRIIYNETTFLFFNFTNEVYIGLFITKPLFSSLILQTKSI